jgi:hypothetical protein
MSLLATAANLAWWATCEPSYRSFRAALNDPRSAQEEILRRYIRQSAGTTFGKEHRFDRINSIESFRGRVPLRDYDEMTPWIDPIAAGESNILTAEPALRLTPTSGSTRARKLIPVTASLQREFNHAISPWIADLFRSDPSLACGSAYWSITPKAVKTNTSMEINRDVEINRDGSYLFPSVEEGEKASFPNKILEINRDGSYLFSRGGVVEEGFDEDAAYLGGWRQRLIDAILAVPSDVRHVTDIDRFRHATMLHLLARRDLRLISVWHPSFLEVLLDYAEAHWEELLDDLATGRSVPLSTCVARAQTPRGLDRAVVDRGLAGNRVTVAAALRGAGKGNWSQVWPHLKLISCWCDAHAAGAAANLSRRLSHAKIQPKGVLATEAFVTIPFQNAHPLAVRSHFVEFLDEHHHAFLVDELHQGATYTLALTTGGGLYRYRLGDRVQVKGFLGRTPSLRFVGRDDHVVDRFGEKLSEGFVANAIQQTLTALQIETPFAMLAFEKGGYTLYIQLSAPPPPRLAGYLDRTLCANPHYAYCRELGQLRPVEVFPIAGNAYAAYTAALTRLGMTLGDIKPAALSDRLDYSEVFANLPAMASSGHTME